MQVSLEKKVDNYIIEIRPFHIFTLSLFLNPGPGLYCKLARTYGQRWVEGVAKIVSEAKSHENLRVRLVEQTDFMCELHGCKQLGINCNADMYGFDPASMRKYGLKFYKEYTPGEILEIGTQMGRNS